MKTLKFTARFLGFIFLAFTFLFSCKKEKTPLPSTGGIIFSQPNCSFNTGYFKIQINGESHELLVDSETHYTNLYNWFGYEESHFVIYGKDQNANLLNVGLALPGKFKLGSTTYYADSIDSEFFEMDIDTNNLYVSKVTFNVTTSELDVDGIYKPMKATFTGTAHSYPWYNGQAPSDTVNISGSICINGYIIQ